MTAAEWLGRMGDWFTPEPNTGCWLWMRSADSSGYGTLNLGGRTASAHRVAYEALRGPIPEGLQIDHLCHTRPCVNPYHMEPVTRRENVLRGYRSRREPKRYAACRRGHPLTPENVYVFAGDGHRTCATCRNAGIERWKERKRAAYIPVARRRTGE